MWATWSLGPVSSGPFCQVGGVICFFDKQI
jgi:hypothetical protein